MNQEIPKPLRNALARQTVGDDVHPSPDMLTSFMERTLTPLESEAVVHHLAQCVECREIVFLASAAAEDGERDERFVAAAAPSRVAAMSVYADALHPAPAQPARLVRDVHDGRCDCGRPRRLRRPRWSSRAG